MHYIKPCPFCGHEPSIEHPMVDVFTIRCNNPNCPVKVNAEGALDLPVAEWNTRAIDKDLLAVEGRLKHLLQSEAVRMYDEKDPKNPSSYARDIAELDHLVFDSKREEKTAHWDINVDGYHPFCSHCGEATQHMSPHCPNCGYRMTTRRHGE